MSYVYESLDFSTEQIRLLTLAPAGNETADIYCNLQTVLLRDRPEYEALSYTWGDTSQECTTYMDGYPFEVTPNRDIALRHLRHPSSPRVLWIDAICINQANVRERNHEVSRMRNIYYHASQVLVWLGESDEDITKAMNFLVGLKDNGDGYKIPKDKTLRAAVIPGLVKIMKKPWWSRIWVVQEFTVAKYYPLVGCGQTRVSWEVFNISIRTLGWEWISGDVNHFPNTDVIFIFSFEDLRNSWRHRLEAERPTLRELLISTDDRDATDPRDHVFAILGLTTEVGDGGILPDYEQTVDLVYKRAMINVLRSSKDLELLVAAVGERKLNLPSWCVDFSMKGWDKRTRLKFSYQKDLRGASGPALRSDVVHDPDAGDLTLTGTVIGSIQDVVPSTCGLSGLKLYYNHMSSFKELGNSEFIDSKFIDSEFIDSEFIAGGQDAYHKFVHDIFIFTWNAFLALKLRLGQDEACKMLAAGDIWKTVDGGRLFNDETFDDLEDETRKTSGDYLLIEQFA